VRELVGSDEALAAIGAATPSFPGWRAVVATLRILSHPTDMYRRINEVVGPSLFGVPRGTLEERDERTLVQTITIPPEYADNPTFFLICLGSYRTNPRLVGHPDAHVEMTLRPREAVYVIRLATYVPRTLWGRVRNAIARLFAMPAAIEEFERSAQELNAQFLRLAKARRQIRRQSALLKRARRRQRKAEAARRLAEQQFQLAQKVEGLGLLAGGVAHDVNNLLASILGNAEMLHDELEDPRFRERIGRIMKAVDRAGDLTGQLLAYAGRRPPENAAIDLSALVGEMGDLARTAVPRNARLRIDAGEALPAVAGDATQLRQVVLNLLTNAAAAVAPTSGTVVVRTGVEDLTPERIAGTWVRDHAEAGRYVFVEVEDDGVGMDAATLARIFDPFSTTRTQGRGLGLAAVLGIVRGHRGVIDVQSAPGAGSRFRVLLPASDSPPPPRPLPREEPDGTARGKVLVADDDPEVRALIATQLERRGLVVLVAANGDDAVTLGAAHGADLDLALIDRTMAGRTGEEVFAALSALAPRARVVLCSGAHDAPALAGLEARGLAGVLQKPFRREELLETVRRLLT
jgi:signal transduction histidine kinase